MNIYKRKSNLVHAEQYLPDKGQTPEAIYMSPGLKGSLMESQLVPKVVTPCGRVQVAPADWIVMDTFGRYFVIRPEIFEAFYELDNED